MPADPVLVVQHVSFEGPGLLARVAEEAGRPLRVVRPRKGDELPADPAGLSGLVVLGGPMSAYDDAEHPFLAQERVLLADAVSAGVPVLGICLGAQLLAAALGARVSTGPAPEVGVGSVQLTAAGCADPVLGAPGAAELPVLHWHGDTFDLPERSVLLASSDAYPHQAFRLGSAYGLQFHVEVDREQAAGLRRYLQAPLTDADADRIEQVGRPILQRWLG